MSAFRLAGDIESSGGSERLSVGGCGWIEVFVVEGVKGIFYLFHGAAGDNNKLPSFVEVI